MAAYAAIMSVPGYVVLFIVVVTMGVGLPVLGDASLIAAGTLAGEGRLNIGVVLATSMVAWMLTPWRRSRGHEAS